MMRRPWRAAPWFTTPFTRSWQPKLNSACCPRQWSSPMKWLTRSHVHVDRVACPWLISRFVDNQAEFLFVPKSQIDQVAAETGAIPFDAPEVELGHVDGRCSF